MNKLIKCKACSKDIAKGVNKCPSCGKDQRNFVGQHKILTGIVVIIAIVIASNIGGESKPTTPTVATSTAVASTTEPTKATPAKPTVPTEYISALAKAETYGDTMNMSKSGIYDQLTSESGEKFSKEAAQYAIDNVKTDWKKNALKKAQTYQKDMSMSPSAVYDQLISASGEKFTAAEAQYAKDNLK
ncbi:Ltp family lipoprotein [Clostridium estertheticum]|uniref:Ltp family lipoprotein n=1 Tax=Clostridium estertheticum TaxID=238834 RepID=UPI001CF2BE4A|nr:Ltp family lipoprotein [Clostridium estertheticum]MCB2309040.1 Ltp family lipoprotein [Clostridium estertheticum]MCB2346826.1 Ltp family lipoprotein [Clostridium estertheticum]MCB2351862.1 Ltp family lipoprotein [Clostridium estertheticum]WAG48390.1 Ltp family lipoprotein [Clostridium estertheticum]